MTRRERLAKALDTPVAGQSTTAKRSRRRLLAFVMVTGVAIGASRAAGAQPSTVCNTPMRDSIMHVEVPGQPFQALPTKDGCWVFASITRTQGTTPAIGVLTRQDGAVRLVRTVPIPGSPTGMVLTHDEKTLIVAAGDTVVFVDVAKLQSGNGSPVIGLLGSSTSPAGRVYANVSPDDAFAFISDERAFSISVINLAEARRTAFKTIPVVGRIPTGNAPIALAFSNDGKWLYTTSQIAPQKLKWPPACKPLVGASANATQARPQGAIIVIDVSLATRSPEKSVAGYVRAGCSPVRLVLSPDGNTAYVSARADNELLVFDTRKFLTDSAHARIGQIKVGDAPVGIAVVNDGRTIIATNSNRFAGNANDKQFLSVLDAAKTVTSSSGATLASIPAGAFPRELRVTSDGKVLIATNFASRTIQFVDLTRFLFEK